MAYDEALAERVRALVGPNPAVSEKKMFGGLAFLINGHMSVAVSGHGGLLLHVDPAQSKELLATTNATPMEMRGHTMTGWLRVSATDVADDTNLSYWIDLSTTYAHQLPPKAKKK